MNASSPRRYCSDFSKPTLTWSIATTLIFIGLNRRCGFQRIRRTTISLTFVLRPKFGVTRGTNWEILDLNLPGDSLVTKANFHPGFTQKVTRAIQQLRDYRTYFGRVDAKSTLIDKFGVQPTNPRISILIGRNRDSERLDHAQGGA